MIRQYKRPRGDKMIKVGACILRDSSQGVVGFCSAGAVQDEASHRNPICHFRHHDGLAVRVDLGIQTLDMMRCPSG